MIMTCFYQVQKSINKNLIIITNSSTIVAYIIITNKATNKRRLNLYLFIYYGFHQSESTTN